MLDFHEAVADYKWTCYACPAQAEGTLNDGLRFYFRYRYGVASLGVGATAAEAIRDVATVSVNWGEALDGVLSQEEFEALFMFLLPKRHTVREEA